MRAAWPALQASLGPYTPIFTHQCSALCAHLRGLDLHCSRTYKPCASPRAHQRPLGVVFKSAKPNARHTLTRGLLSDRDQWFLSFLCLNRGAVSGHWAGLVTHCARLVGPCGTLHHEGVVSVRAAVRRMSNVTTLPDFFNGAAFTTTTGPSLGGFHIGTVASGGGVTNTTPK